MIKSFNKKEAEDREKYGDRVFLKKYINRYKSYTSWMKWLLPMVVIVNLILVVIYLDEFINHNRVSDLVILILWSLGTILWVIGTFLNFTAFFAFVEEKVVSWKKELENIDKQKPI